jgi:hypothetical protein
MRITVDYIRNKVKKSEDLTAEEKLFIGSYGVTKDLSARELAGIFLIGKTSAHAYKDSCLKARNIPKNNGRPTNMTENDEKELKKIVTNSGTMHLKKTIVVEEANKLRLSNIQSRTKYVVKPTQYPERSLKRLFDKIEFKTGNAAIQTQARSEAGASKANVITFAAVTAGIVPLIDPNMLLNTDATQGGSGRKMLDKAACVYVGDRPDSGLKVDYAQGDRTAAGIISIKWYPTLSAGGFCSDPIDIIEDDDMDPDMIDVYQINGMGFIASMDNKGYIVFLKSRAALNAAFYRWHIKNILIPFVKLIRHHKYLPEDAMAYHQSDGELNQISIFTEPEIQNMLIDNHIIQAKQNPSNTEREQPADAGDVFRAWKGALRGINDADVQHEVALLKALSEACKAHANKMHEEIRGYKEIPWPTLRNAKMALLKMRLARMQVMTPTLVMNGFRKVGIYPYSLEQIVDNCSAKWTSQEFYMLCEALPRLIKTVISQGQLTWQDILSVGIDLGDDISKDTVTLTHKRFVILTHHAVIRQMQEAKESKEAADEAKARKKEADKLKRDAAMEKKRLKAITVDLTTPLVKESTVSSSVASTPLVLNFSALRASKN